MGLKGRACRSVATAIFSLITLDLPLLASSLAASASHPSLAEPIPAIQDQDVSSPVSLAREIQAALTEGEVDRARDSLRKLLSRPRLDSDLLLRVGVALARSELYAEASEVFARCAKDHPENFEAHYNLALAEFAQQKLPEAAAALEASPHGSPQEEIARSYLGGKIEAALGKTSKAQRDLEAAFAGAPREENYALDLGLFYVRQRDYRRATQVLERGVNANPQSPFLLLGLSLSQLLSGQQVESVETSRKALKLEPDFPPAQLLMVYALYLDGKLEDAERVAAQGLALPRPSPYLYYLHAALSLKRQSREYDRILEELAIANRTIPHCSLCYLAQSKAHEALRDNQAAIADLEAAVRANPSFSDAWYRLAILYRSVGRSENASGAREQFQRIKANKDEQETEMLRNGLVQTLSDPQGTTQPP